MKRPFSVTILLWLVLSLTVWSALRLYTAIQWWSTLHEFASPPGPFYIAVSGGIWLIAGIVLLWGMWQSQAWVRYALLAAGVAFIIWYWGDRFLFQMPGGNTVFALLASIFLLIVLSICVFVPGTKTFFIEREAHER